MKVKHLENTVPELALFGATPIFTSQFCVNKPNIGNKKEYYKRLDEMFNSRIFTNDGPYVKELEQKIASYLGVKHCVLTCNGTMALQLICKALDLKGEVIIPSFTFIATAHALQWQGLKPVFCDIGANSHNIDPDSCHQLMTTETSAILGVHLWGKGCQIDELEDMVSGTDIKLFFDAAHSFGSYFNDQLIGGFGEAEAFSFHATKVFNTFEGGAVTTNSDELAVKIRNLRNFGFVDYDCVNGLGINAKMPEVCAAMGLTNLDQLEDNIQDNKVLFDYYFQSFSQIKGIEIFNYSEKSNYQYVVAQVDEQELGLSRDELLSILHAENILVRRYFYPGCHLMQPYVNDLKAMKHRPVRTESLTKRILVFPNGYDISKEIIDKIATFIKRVSNNAIEIKKNMY